MPRDGTATRTRILDAAEHLVIENGYAATSVDQVLAESGSSKGAFFHHFPSKQELAKALVERYVAADVANLDAALEATAGLAPRDRAIALVRHFEELGDDIMSAQSSCLYVAVLTERQLVADGTSDDVRRAVEVWRDGVAAVFREALGDRPGVDVDALADHLWVTFEGAFLLCRSTGDPSHMRAQLRTLRQLLEALLP